MEPILDPYQSNPCKYHPIFIHIHRSVLFFLLIWYIQSITYYHTSSLLSMNKHIYIDMVMGKGTDILSAWTRVCLIMYWDCCHFYVSICESPFSATQTNLFPTLTLTPLPEYAWHIGKCSKSPTDVCPHGWLFSWMIVKMDACNLPINSSKLLQAIFYNQLKKRFSFAI